MSCVLFYSFSSVESQGEGHANHVYALLPKTVKQLPLAVAMWLHPLMNPCQFPACSRQLQMQRAHSPRPAPLSVFPSRHRAASSLHTLDLPHCLHEDSAFLRALHSPPLFPILSFSLLVTLCIVHCLLATVRCLFAVCLFANATRFTLVPGLVFGSAPPHSYPLLGGPRHCLISTNDVLLQ